MNIKAELIELTWLANGAYAQHTQRVQQGVWNVHPALLLAKESFQRTREWEYRSPCLLIALLDAIFSSAFQLPW